MLDKTVTSHECHGVSNKQRLDRFLNSLSITISNDSPRFCMKCRSHGRQAVVDKFRRRSGWSHSAVATALLPRKRIVWHIIWPDLTNHVFWSLWQFLTAGLRQLVCLIRRMRYQSKNVTSHANSGQNAHVTAPLQGWRDIMGAIGDRWTMGQWFKKSWRHHAICRAIGNKRANWHSRLHTWLSRGLSELALTVKTGKFVSNTCLLYAFVT